MGPLAISLIMAVAVSAFCWLSWRKLSILTALRPEVRWDRPAKRLARVLKLGLMQTRMIAMEPGAGLIHAAIFIGFLILLVRKVQLIVIGYAPHFVYPGVLGGAYATLKDLVELVVVVAVGLAFWRRFVLRPRRLEPNREATLVLSLILAIMLTDFAFDGFRFALLAPTVEGIAHERSFAFVGSALATLLGGLAPATLEAGMHAFYWIQLLTVFSFLVILPTGEHFHIVTALPALFFGRSTPLARVPSVDLEKAMSDEAGDDMRIGIRTAADLSWKDGFDAFTCTECGRCKDACPTFLTGKPLALKWMHDSVKQHLLAESVSLRAGKTADLPPLVGSVISEDTLWACTTCGYCEHACPIELEHLGKLFGLRQHQVMMEGSFPHELKTVFEAYESQGNPWGLPSDTRGDWASELDVPLLTSAEQAKEIDWLFYVGSAQSFDDRGRKVARAFVRLMQAAGVRFAILGRSRRVHRGVRATRRQRDAVPESGAVAGRDPQRLEGDPHRHLRSTRLQLAEERVPGVRRQLGGCAPHAVARSTDRRRPTQAAGHQRARDLPRALLPGSPQCRVRSAAAHPGPVDARCPAGVRSEPRQGDVLWRGWRTVLDGRDDRHPHQRAACGAGTGEAAARHRHRLPLLRDDDQRRAG
jgi:ferredoxin